MARPCALAGKLETAETASAILELRHVLRQGDNDTRYVPGHIEKAKHSGLATYVHRVENMDALERGPLVM